MSFVSPLFLYFLLFFFCGTLVLKGKSRLVFYTFFSYLFYASAFPPYVLLLLTSSVLDFHIGRKLHDTGSPAARKALLIGSLTVNLSLLATFKYLDYFIELANGLMSLTPISYQWTQPHLLLPVGISFYTFQTLSYTIDIYRKQLKPTDSFLEFACFVSFFPQLVAGPIVRASQFLPQIQKASPFAAKATLIGVELVLLGLFKKTVIADNLAPMVEVIFNSPLEQTGATLWLGCFLFAIQIYADFSGYTDVARGLGKILGFDFPVNFRWPYLSQSIQDFWRRWHMTLSFWIRDYLYFSLGGSRVSFVRFVLNMLLTWTLMGLWHGASTTFVIWGLYHGMLLIGLKLKQKVLPNWQLPAIVNILVTFILVVFGWAAFRAQSLYDLSVIWHKMLTDLGHIPAIALTPMLLILGVCIAHFYTGATQYTPEKQQTLTKLHYPTRLIGIASLIIIMIISAGSTESFIYFAF